MTTINQQLQFRFKGEQQWKNFPEFPTVDNTEHLFFEHFMHNHSSSDYIAWEEDLYMWINDECTTEEFKTKGYDIPTKWQAEDERKRLRQIIINETMEDFFTDLSCGKIELKNRDDKPQELFVFMYAVDRHERNISDEEIIRSWEESDGDDLDTERYTPDEFACKVNDEEFCDSIYWIRFIKM